MSKKKVISVSKEDRREDTLGQKLNSSIKLLDKDVTNTLSEQSLNNRESNTDDLIHYILKGLFTNFAHTYTGFNVSGISIKETKKQSEEEEIEL